ncbi:anti-sigma factor [Demequina sp.]|uniref:anti-sigma factor n=1 Tax=Demequina sp. TaxID=2050685 RepID=UPI0025D0D262|nr:anti-sigma factor [Demequina sp.]
MSDNVHGLLGAYAVDAVTPAERAEFEAHLPACEECSLELGSLLETTAVLADAESTAPPAALRARVFEEIGRTAQLPPADGPAADAAPAPEPVAAAVVPIERARRRHLWPRLAVAAASVAVLAVAGVIGGGLVADRNAQLALEQDVMMVASAPDAHSMDLGLGSAHLVVSEKMASVVAMGDDCPSPDDGMEYQLWVVMADGSKHAGPTFMPDSDGSFVTMLDMEMNGVVAFAVTEEPHGGSAQPTSEEIAVVEL